MDTSTKIILALLANFILILMFFPQLIPKQGLFPTINNTNIAQSNYTDTGSNLVFVGVVTDVILHPKAGFFAAESSTEIRLDDGHVLNVSGMNHNLVIGARYRFVIQHWGFNGFDTLLEKSRLDNQTRT